MDQPGFEPGPKADDTLLIKTKLPTSRAHRIMWNSLLLATLLLTLPFVYSAVASRRHHSSSSSSDVNAFKILPTLLRNLVEEGLIKKGHRGFVSGAGTGDLAADLAFLRDSGIDLLTGPDLKPDEEGPPKVFDFVFAPDFVRAQALDAVVKQNGGLVIAPLTHNPSDGPRLSSGYKVVYLRRFKSTVVAMRKNGPESSKEVVTSEEKKAALLKGLEDVDLEPPRHVGGALEVKSKIKFLPDLLSDSLDEYPRRVFISDDSSAVDWFYGNYPTKDQEFEVYNVGGNEGVSRWLSEKVRPEDYVVMKAEAQVVEDMLRDKTVSLVDELFLECKNQWAGGEEEEEMNGSKRAYWQCLTLYGKVRDEGIAVHQWWD